QGRHRAGRADRCLRLHRQAVHQGHARREGAEDRPEDRRAGVSPGPHHERKTRTMKMDELAALLPDEPVTASPEVFQQLGAITRMLHDTLHQLGVMPRLQAAADGLPDARSRLNYIASKTAQAAEKVLDSVDSAKLEHQRIAADTRLLAAALTADPVRAVASGA